MGDRSRCKIPRKDAPLPANFAELTAYFNNTGQPGHFASVVVTNSADPFNPRAKENRNFLPLLRGHGMLIRFAGLQSLQSKN